MGCSTAQHSPSLPVHSLPQTPLSSNPNLRRALTAFPPSTHPPTRPPTCRPTRRSSGWSTSSARHARQQSGETPSAPAGSTLPTRSRCAEAVQKPAEAGGKPVGKPVNSTSRRGGRHTWGPHLITPTTTCIASLRCVRCRHPLSGRSTAAAGSSTSRGRSRCSSERAAAFAAASAGCLRCCVPLLHLLAL